MKKKNEKSTDTLAAPATLALRVTTGPNSARMISAKSILADFGITL